MLKKDKYDWVKKTERDDQEGNKAKSVSKWAVADKTIW